MSDDSVFGSACCFFCLGNDFADEATVEQRRDSCRENDGDDSIFNLLSSSGCLSGLEWTKVVEIGEVTEKKGEDLRYRGKFKPVIRWKRPTSCPS